MKHGFERKHFELLRRWGGHHYDSTSPEQARAYQRLAAAYEATDAWASALQLRLFPFGRVVIRKAPINQGQAFSPYTWAKIYPAPSSPKALAFTVGIDADGFTVKIDTVGETVARSAYVALRGAQNMGAPFANILPSEAGLELSFEALVEWSINSIRDFRMGYEEVLQRIGLALPKVTFVTDESASRQGFAAWRQSLQAGAVQKGSLLWLLEGAIVMRPSKSGRTPDADRMELGVDPLGRFWAVQINEPRIAGDHNSLSAIGVDAAGGRLLLRQGFLRPNEPGGHTISGAEFVSRTGLAPIAVEAADLAARRQWFRVCSLDSTSEEMRLATGAFVDRCAAARLDVDAGEPIAEPAEAFAAGETGGSYKVGAKATEERTIPRHHGAVYLALAELLGGAALRCRKGLHPLGFEVDAEIDGGGLTPLLIEIKTGTSAGEIHTGVGQLHLYPRLITRLAKYDRALLLPQLPAPDVRAAVEACGIAIYTFGLEDLGDDNVDVSFSPDFLIRCGLDPT
ncbi:MAG: 5-methylcytosine-specific restriction enzyme [Sphingomonadales bacterium]|jgi:hypothetical protein|nr:5-methylcytosine-specific restriction enzyme [Sphingomonadales bacterium]